MRVRLYAIVFALVVAPFAVAAEEENPYKKVKVGEFATYKLVMKVAGMNLEGTITQAVTAKSDKEATLKVTGTANGMEIPAQEHKIDLTKPFDPLKSTFPADAEVKMEKLKDGKEKVKVAGKEYDSKWEQVKMKVKTKDMEIESEVKMWSSKDLPLLIVKMEMTMDVLGMKIEMEMVLSETGKKSD